MVSTSTVYHQMKLLFTFCYIGPTLRIFAVSKITVKIDGVKDFNYGELALATNNFDVSAQVGQGGYGKVYKGTLADGTVVAIKRAQEGSLQGEKEFLTEIELLSRLHHRNLVSLLGYCDEESEQVPFLVESSLKRNLKHFDGRNVEIYIMVG